MRVWLYARLSNDDDNELNSLQNQLEICRSFAQQQGFSIVGESFDDNISGMTFQRNGITQLSDAAEHGLFDGVIVKDLSRLGRHKVQTSLFLDFLREYGIRVISVTENLDTTKEEDDLLIGIRTVMNDFYAKDIGNKIRSGYKQKLKKGLVITPPFGYRKDRNTGQILIHEEAAQTVRMVFALYMAGLGQRAIARKLNDLGRKTPAQLRNELCGRDFVQTHKDSNGRYQWSFPSIKNILVKEEYTGVLINHFSETNSGHITRIPPSERYRHEGYLPQIISKEQWQAAQTLLRTQARSSYGNKPSHRYAGLLRCKDCGNVFVPMIRIWKGKKRVEYVCRGYQRNGKDFCSSHRIHEEVLDQQVTSFVLSLRDQYVLLQHRLLLLQKVWVLNQPRLSATIQELENKVQALEADIDYILMEKIQLHS